MNEFKNYILNKISSTEEEINCNNLLKLIFNTTNHNDKIKLLIKCFKLNPRNGNILTQLGLINLSINTELAIFFFDCAFNNKIANPTIPINSHQGIYIASIVGRYKIDKQKYIEGEYYFNLINSSNIKIDDVAKIQLSTLITGYPKSKQDCSKILQNLNNRLNFLLKKDKLSISSILNDSNPYFTCLLPSFNLEIYYEADFKLLMNKFYELTIKIFPNLKYTNNKITKLKKKSKYDIGIVSSFFYKGNSVISDFSGILDNLPEDKFNIYYFYLKMENNYDNNYLSKKKNKYYIFNNSLTYLNEYRKKIESMDLDLLLYLDSTMSYMTQQALMSRLSRVQAVSHGHPVTSGISKEYVDYYVSWGAAELEYELSKNNYTEELILLPKDKMHQYYSPRSTPDKISCINNLSFKHITRKDYADYTDTNGNWYLCMQKSFKRHPIFDEMIAEILEKDKFAKILLHDCEINESKLIIINRFKNLKCDLNRIIFIPAQPHHKLMGLYNISDIVLDSYYAGGCTTSREAFELGCIIITLPGKYLGSRWTYGYYNIMGITECIAKNKDDYVNLAIKYANNIEEKNKLKNKILNNKNKLFYKHDAIDSWTNIIETMILSKN